MIKTQVSFKEMVDYMTESTGFVIPEYSAKNMYRKTTYGDNRIIPSQHFTVFENDNEDRCIYTSEDGRKIYIQSLLDPNDDRNVKSSRIMNQLEAGLKLLGQDLLAYLDFRYNDYTSRIKYNDYHLIIANELPYLSPILLMNYGPSDQVLVGDLGDIYLDPCEDRIVGEDEPWAFVQEFIQPELIVYSEFGKMVTNEEYKIKNFVDYKDPIQMHIGEKMYIRSYFVNDVLDSWDFPCDRGYKNTILGQLYKRLEYDSISNSFKEITRVNQNRDHTFIAIDEKEFFADPININRFEGFSKRSLSRINPRDKMTISKLSDNISDKYLDIVALALQTHKFDLRNAVAQILLRGYSSAEGIIDIPEDKDFQNLNFVIARISDVTKTSPGLERKVITNLEDDTQYDHVILLRTCDPEEDDYGPIFIPLIYINGSNKLLHIDKSSYENVVTMTILEGLIRFFGAMVPTINGHTSLRSNKLAAVTVNSTDLYISDFRKYENITRWTVAYDPEEYVTYGSIIKLDVGFIPKEPVDIAEVKEK